MSFTFTPNPPSYMGAVYDIGGVEYNVKAPKYGAIGDGITDDSVAIQAAITAAQTAGNGAVVRFPAGIYLVSRQGSLSGTDAIGTGVNSTDYALWVSAGNIALRGEGATIKLANGQVAAINKYIAPLIIGGNGPSGQFSDVTVEGITIDGGDQATAGLGTAPTIITAGAIFVCGGTPTYGTGLSNIHIRRCKTKNTVTTIDQGAIELHGQVQYSSVSFCRVDSPSGTGIFLDGASSCLAFGNVVTSPGRGGIATQANSDNDTAPPTLSQLQALSNRIVANKVLNPSDAYTVTISATGGTFTLSYGGQTTAAIAFNASSLVLQQSLAALSSIGAGNVLVLGAAGGGPYTVIPWGTLAGTATTALTGNNAGLTGGASTVTISQAGFPGIAASTQYSEIANNDLVNTGNNTSGNYGIQLVVYRAASGTKTYPASNNTITGNHIKNGYYGINLVGNTDNAANPVYVENNAITGNVFEGTFIRVINAGLNARNNLLEPNLLKTTGTGTVTISDSTATGNFAGRNLHAAGGTPVFETSVPGLTGPLFALPAVTVQDRATNGTLASFAVASIAQPTLSALNAGTTTTNAHTLYIAGAPLAGTNETITNPWALGVNGPVNLLNSSLQINAVKYGFPASQGAANTYLKNDGAGALSWAAAGGAVYVAAAPSSPITTVTNQALTITAFSTSYQFAAGALSVGKCVEFRIAGVFTTDSSTQPAITLKVRLNTGSTTYVLLTIPRISGMTFPISLSNAAWMLDGWFTVASVGAGSGTIHPFVRFTAISSANSNAETLAKAVGDIAVAPTFDSTVAETLEITMETASTVAGTISMTIQQMSVKVIN